ncbi:hypothetical protein Rs2_04627 [Raphanus sativus]|nr:hypothetical protein Rs2_04627 [Raphanus sativus]
MFCKESPSLQTLSTTHSTASQSNIAQTGKLLKEKVQKIKVKGFLTAEEGTLLESLSWSRPLDVITDIRGRSLLVELVSAETDTRTIMEKDPVEDYVQRVWFESRNEKYKCVFDTVADVEGWEGGQLPHMNFQKLCG